MIKLPSIGKKEEINMKRKLSDGEIKSLILRVLYSMGFSYTTYGYRCLRDTILMSLKNKNALFDNIAMLKIHCVIADKYGTDNSSVRMGIRNAIHFAWKRCDRYRYDNVRSNIIKYGFDPSVIPRRDEFVVQITKIIDLKIKEIESSDNEDECVV